MRTVKTCKVNRTSTGIHSKPLNYSVLQNLTSSVYNNPNVKLWRRSDTRQQRRGWNVLSCHQVSSATCHINNSDLFKHAVWFPSSPSGPCRWFLIFLICNNIFVLWSTQHRHQRFLNTPCMIGMCLSCRWWCKYRSSSIGVSNWSHGKCQDHLKAFKTNRCVREDVTC